MGLLGRLVSIPLAALVGLNNGAAGWLVWADKVSKLGDCNCLGLIITGAYNFEGTSTSKSLDTTITNVLI